MINKSVKPQKFHKKWLSTYLKPLEVSQKVTNFHFTLGNPPLSVQKDVSKLQTRGLLNLKTGLFDPNEVKLPMLEEKFGQNW